MFTGFVGGILCRRRLRHYGGVNVSCSVLQCVESDVIPSWDGYD